MGNFVQNTGNLLKSLLANAGGNIQRGMEVFSDYLRKPQGDVTSDYLVSPLPDKTPEPQYTPTPQPRANFARTSYYLPTGGLTATGTVPKSGYTAAITRELLDRYPMGTLIQMPDGSIRRIEDLTSQDIDEATLDLFYGTAQEANYPTNGLMRNQSYPIVGRDLEGLKYNY